MNDEDNMEKDNAEEYQYSGDEYSTAVKPDQKSATTGSKRRRLFLIIGAVLAAVVLYKIVSFVVGSKPKTSETQAPTPISNKITPINNQPIISKSPAPTVSQLTPTQPSIPPEAIQKINQQLSGLNDQISRLSYNLNNMESNLSDLGDRVSTLSTALQSVQQELVKAKEKPKQVVKAVHRLDITYTVRALIPGRAWLSASTGDAITVAVGDKIPGYGVVQSIDIKQGIVATSSGKVIGYNETSN